MDDFQRKATHGHCKRPCTNEHPLSLPAVSVDNFSRFLCLFHEHQCSISKDRLRGIFLVYVVMIRCVKGAYPWHDRHRMVYILSSRAIGIRSNGSHEEHYE